MPLPATFWNKAPFVRLFMALAAGIVLQWHLQFSFLFLTSILFIDLLVSAAYFFISLKSKFRLGFINGIALHLAIAVIGALLIWVHDIRHHKNWIGNKKGRDACMIVTLQEPLVEKTNSFKARASIEEIYDRGNLIKTDGEIILYFKKNVPLQQLHYGSRIVFSKPVQEIRNTGNPGGFDYKRYSLFQGITHQINLSATEFKLLGAENRNPLRQFIFDCRQWVVQSLRSNIPGEKEQGLAEALLIGYKDDLDRNLVQSYTNTGVVHIIAISGMHLALIYGLLVLLTRPLRRKPLRWLRTGLILCALWLFTLLAGAEASVVRSAVMFTCIALAEVLSRRTSVYNTLALSAFLLLIYDPFWLWDVGFQLSYAAVISIVTFYRPVYNWLYLPNKALDFIWKTTAVSLAAQILTTPVSLFHFHQFPVLFLPTNLIAVPLSSLILFSEIAVCLLSWLTPLALLSGRCAGWLIYLMNSYIERMNTVSFSLWSGFSITVAQTFLLLLALTTICFWLMEKRKWLLWTTLISLLAFTCFRSWSFHKSYRQKKLIVYNISKYTAIDLVVGRSYAFIGDSALLSDDFIRNFHLQPSRILYRMEEKRSLFPNKDFRFCRKRIIVMDSPMRWVPHQSKSLIDVLILGKNPKLSIASLLQMFFIHQIVIDGSVPPWKAKQWEQDCALLQIPCYNVVEKGAFVMNL